MLCLFLTAGIGDVAAEDPGLLVMMLFYLLGWLLVLGAGLFFIVFLLVMAAIFTALGAFTLATVVGVYQRSVAGGFRWFIRLCCQAMCIVFAFFIAGFMHWSASLPLKELLITGLAVGCFAGYVLEKLFLWLLRRINRFIR